MTVTYQQCHKLCMDYMLSCGMPEADAEVLVEAAMAGSLRGVTSHGISRLPVYRGRIEAGVVNRAPKPQIAADAGALLLVDGDNGLGQVVTKFALDEAVRRAKEYGTCCAAVRHSNHIGMLAYYALKAAEQGMISFVVCHTMPFAAAPGSSTPIVGTNPHCWGFPCREGPIVLDMAITVARGKIKDAFVAGKDIPLGWAVDKYGKDTTDAAAALEGLLLPIGGAKGYGLGVVAVMLSGVLSGVPAAGDIVHSLDDLEHEANCGTFLMVMDPSKITDMEGYLDRTSAFRREVKAGKTWDPQGAIYLPGEIENHRAAQQMEKGVEIDEKTYRILTGQEQFHVFFDASGRGKTGG